VQIEAAVAAAAARGLQLQTLKVDDLGMLRDAFAAAEAQHAQGLIILSSPLFSAISGIAQVAEQARLHRLPGITLFPEFPKSGGLMGYGPSLDDLYPRPASMIAKILRGEKPGTCRWNGQAGTALSSTSGQPRRLVSSCRRRWSREPTR
jgi:putative tryptophan/tyrosine transport system substrate-binding protein